MTTGLRSWLSEVGPIFSSFGATQHLLAASLKARTARLSCCRPIERWAWCERRVHERTRRTSLGQVLEEVPGRGVERWCEEVCEGDGRPVRSRLDHQCDHVRVSGGGKCTRGSATTLRCGLAESQEDPADQSRGKKVRHGGRGDGADGTAGQSVDRVCVTGNDGNMRTSLYRSVRSVHVQARSARVKGAGQVLS
jgi:hypothetical protein